MILIFKETSIPTRDIWIKYPELEDYYRQPHRLVKILTKHNFYDAYGYSKFRFIIVGPIDESMKAFIKAHINMGRAIAYEVNDSNWE